VSFPPSSRAAGNRAPVAPPAAETVRSPAWVGTLAVLLGVMAFAYAGLFGYCVKEWVNKPDYSHGFLVPLFAAYLAWHGKDRAPKYLQWPNPWGLAFIGGGALLFVAAGSLNIAKEWLQGVSFVLSLCGAALLLGGWPTLRWLAPSLAFLMFMFPLPYKVEHALGPPSSPSRPSGSRPTGRG
jgi:hypothetical protein